MRAKRLAGSRILLVMGREIGQRLRARAFLVSTALLVVVVLAGGVANRWLSGDDADPVDIAVVGDAPAGLDAAIRSTRDLVDIELRLRSLPDTGEATLESALRDGTVDAVVRAERSIRNELCMDVRGLDQIGESVLIIEVGLHRTLQNEPRQLV